MRSIRSRTFQAEVIELLILSNHILHIMQNEGFIFAKPLDHKIFLGNQVIFDHFIKKIENFACVQGISTQPLFCVHFNYFSNVYLAITLCHRWLSYYFEELFAARSLGQAASNPKNNKLGHTFKTLLRVVTP